MFIECQRFVSLFISLDFHLERDATNVFICQLMVLFI